MREILPKCPPFTSSQLMLVLAAPLALLTASCSTPTGPVEHQHGKLVHIHELVKPTTSQEHDHGDGKLHSHTTPSPVKEAAKKPAAKVSKPAPKSSPKPKIKSAKPAPKVVTKPSAKLPNPPVGLFHKHHGHLDPITGVEGVPC